MLGDGLPSPRVMTFVGERLQQYLAEHDDGQWSPPLEVAAAVADPVDAAVLYQERLPAS